ncbi:MAG: recombinase family protein [Gaiellaceae bacterium]
MSPKKITKPLDIYVRVSRVGGRGGDSVISPELQEEECRALAQARGLDVGHVFIDLDRSGGKMDRPEFEKVLARIEGQVSGGVIVARIDRFARTLVGGLQAIEHIEQAGGVVLTADGEFDSSTATGELVLRIMLSLAAFELRRISEQWEEAKEKARARGVHIGGPRAGYTRGKDGKLVEHPEHPEHLDAVKAAFALRARGGSWKEAADKLTEAGVPTSKSNGRAKSWSRQAMRNVVQNHAYREDKGGPISVWQWEKAQPKAGEARVRGEGYVLGQGLVRCSVCGAGMHKSSNGQRYVVLRCDTPGHGHPTINYETARDYVLSLAFSHVGPRLRREPDGDEAKREALHQAVEEARAAFEQAREMLGVTPPPDSKPAVTLRDAEATLTEFQSTADAPLGLGDFMTPVGVRAEFEKLPVPEQRRVLRSIVERVTLSPGRGKPGDRIVVEFVDGSRWPAPQGEIPGDDLVSLSA